MLSSLTKCCLILRLICVHVYCVVRYVINNAGYTNFFSEYFTVLSLGFTVYLTNFDKTLRVFRSLRLLYLNVYQGGDVRKVIF